MTSFLNPFALLLGLLGGIIVLIYLLKLRRQKEEVSSTLLWVKSMEDLVANAPFQRGGVELNLIFTGLLEDRKDFIRLPRVPFNRML